MEQELAHGLLFFAQTSASTGASAGGVEVFFEQSTSGGEPPPSGTSLPLLATGAATATAGGGGGAAAAAGASAPSGASSLVCAAGDLCKCHPSVYDGILESSHFCFGCDKRVHSNMLCGQTLVQLRAQYNVRIEFFSRPAQQRIRNAGSEEGVLICFQCIGEVSQLWTTKQPAAGGEDDDGVVGSADPPGGPPGDPSAEDEDDAEAEQAETTAWVKIDLSSHATPPNVEDLDDDVVEAVLGQLRTMQAAEVNKCVSYKDGCGKLMVPLTSFRDAVAAKSKKAVLQAIINHRFLSREAQDDAKKALKEVTEHNRKLLRGSLKELMHPSEATATGAEGGGAEEGGPPDEEEEDGDTLMGRGSSEGDRSDLAGQFMARGSRKTQRKVGTFATTVGAQGDVVSCEGVDKAMRHSAQAIDRMHCPARKGNQPRRSLVTLEVMEVLETKVLGGRPSSKKRREKILVNVVARSGEDVQFVMQNFVEAFSSDEAIAAKYELNKLYQNDASLVSPAVDVYVQRRLCNRSGARLNNVPRQAIRPEGTQVPSNLPPAAP